jgi:hypothetical protein
LPETLLERNAAAHERLADAYVTADPAARDLFRFVQMRLLLEAAASVTPIHSHVPATRLIPPRRRFLSPVLRDRVKGCAAAIRHLDVRATMRVMGHVVDVLDIETPMVINALVERANPSARETNPGLPRATKIGFDPTETDFRPPDGSEVRGLLLDAVDVVNHVPAPPIARAGWLAVTVFAVHPFVDGNGRTARLLFNAVNSSGLGLGLDWGSLERWASDRRTYVDAIKQTQDMPSYEPDRIDPLPFMNFAAEKSAEGAEVCHRRLSALVRFVDAQRSRGMSDEAIAVLGAISADRNEAVEDLYELPLERTVCRETLAELGRAGLVHLDQCRRWQPTGDNPFRYLLDRRDPE